jgi:hypothetical protein
MEFFNHHHENLKSYISLHLFKKIPKSLLIKYSSI